MSSNEIVLDFERVSAKNATEFFTLTNKNNGAAALRAIRSAIVSVGGKPLVLENLKSTQANALLATISREMLTLPDAVPEDGAVIDLDGWYIADQDDYYRAVAASDFAALDKLLPKVVVEGPGRNSQGEWTSTASINFEEYLMINKAIGAAIRGTFAEGN